MSNRERAFWRKAGRSAWICAAVLAVLAGALYLTVKEYGLNARFALSPDGPQADSIALSVAHRLKSDYLAKGGALSAMEGDFSCLLAKSIAEPKGRVNKALNSFSPDSSLLAMKKLCVRARGNEVGISYFSYDSLCAERTFKFFKDRCVGMVPKGFEVSEKAGGTFWDNLLSGKWAGTFPWRTCVLAAAILFVIWLLSCLFAWLRCRKIYGKAGFSNMKQAGKAVGESMLLGGVEEVSPFREKYGNVLRWQFQSEDIAKRIAEEAGGDIGSMVNILGIRESDIYFFKRCGLLSAILKSGKVNLMECGRDIEASSTAYLYPDISRLKEENSANMLLMVHPPLSECKVPRPYLENASLNVILSPAEDGWPESSKALVADIPNCRVVLLGLPCGAVGITDPEIKKQSLKAQKAGAFLPARRHFRFIVLLSDSYTDALVEKTCKNLYYSSTGEDVKQAESLLEVSTALLDYVVRPFRTTSSRILSNLEFSASDADAVVMLKAGCTVSKGFLDKIACALDAGVESVQCRLKGKWPKGSFTGFAVTWHSLEELKSLEEKERRKFFMDYLADTSVFFS
ncbi:MAG: hypothetical protein J6X91_05015 [Bacteroidales bacterium]|nr:hypothetical protein [Bacteroidales bacterium]